jgi:uncharacterized membrane protein
LRNIPIVRQFFLLIIYAKCTLNLPTANEDIMMVIPTWMFLVVAIVLAIVIGRLGTVLKDRFAQHESP